MRAEPYAFASLIDFCHLKNSELEPQFQKYKGRIVLRGDIVKMIQDHMQYSLNRDHQRHKGRLKHFLTRLPGCAGKQTQYQRTPRSNMEDHFRKNPKSECPDIWIRPPKHKWPQIMVQYGRSNRSC